MINFIDIIFHNRLRKINNDLYVVTYKNGTVSRMRFKYNLSEVISEEKNPPLMNGDQVKIYPTNLARLGKCIKGVTDPEAGIVNAITLFRIIEGN